MSGLTADARTLIDHARVEAQSHRFTYDEPMKVISFLSETQGKSRIGKFFSFLLIEPYL